MCFCKDLGLKAYESVDLVRNLRISQEQNKTKSMRRCVDALLLLLRSPALTRRFFSAAASWRDQR
jgi:hypothetical protein